MGQPELPPIERPLVETRNVTPGFFAATGQRLIAGRLLDAREMQPVTSVQRVVVNQALASRDFPNTDAMGRRIYNGDRWIEMVGGRVETFATSARSRIRVPRRTGRLPSDSPAATGYNLVIRTHERRSDGRRGSGRACAARSVSRCGHLACATDDHVDVVETSAGPRFVFALFATLAGVALILALAGLFGILSYTVEQQQREYALRQRLARRRRPCARSSSGVRVESSG